MDLKHLRILVAAIEHGSIQAAARRLNIAQPALSRRIMDLEAELGCELLVRGGRGVVPTEAGLALYRDGLSILDSVGLAERRAQRLGIEQAQQIRFGLVQTARKYPFIQSAISAFNAAHPEAGVALTRGFSSELAAAVREGQLDATLLYEQHIGSQRCAERLIHKERYVLAAHPSHRLAKTEPASLEELSGEPLVCMARQDTTHNHNPLLEQLRLHGLEPVIGRWASTPEELIDFVIVSGGLCVTPASSIRSVPQGHLVFRTLPDFGMELDLTLGWSRVSQTASLDAFLASVHGAIDRHQDEISAGRSEWTSLDGMQLFRVIER
jgi:DNA-binding transcriptional LysR family regulator